MKKVGILTFHGAHNYGSVLQSYASVQILRKLGLNPEIINLRNKDQRDLYKILTPYHGIQKLFRILIYPILESRYNKFERFINQRLPLSNKLYNKGSEIDIRELDYDIYLAGSDQIWNPSCLDFETAYYMDFVKHKFPTISYAPSFGKSHFEESDRNLIRSLLENVNYLSSRERSGVELIENLTGRNAVQVCDPVMLLNNNDWTKLSEDPKIGHNYILAYFLNNNHGDRSQLNYLRKSTGYKVILLNEYIRDFINPRYRTKLNTSPEQFLGLIKNASIVYTNSFHATAFSVIFEKQFYTAVAKDENVKNNNDSRKIDFLKSLNLEDQIIINGSYIDLSKKIDYSPVRIEIDNIKKRSLNYLINAISKRPTGY